MPLAAERRFRAMGTECHVVVNGPGAADRIEAAIERIVDLERRWSRFLPDSEVSRMNRAGGAPTRVSTETLDLVEKAVFAWQLTDGAYDPTMLFQLCALGYDRPFDTISTASSRGVQVGASLGCGDIRIDRAGRTVTLPPGCGFDAGGIGKGAAADLVSGELIDAGAWGAMVNMGGDLRARGVPPVGLEWVVSIHEPTVTDEPAAIVHLQDGAVATSTTAKRRWNDERAERHHLLDPATGLPSDTSVRQVSVVAGEAWWAEVCATALIRQENPELPNCSALRVLTDGSVEHLGALERYER